MANPTLTYTVTKNRDPNHPQIPGEADVTVSATHLTGTQLQALGNATSTVVHAINDPGLPQSGTIDLGT